MRHTTIRLPEEIWERLEAEARAEHGTVAQVIRRAVAQYLASTTKDKP